MIAASHIDLLRVIRAPGRVSLGLVARSTEIRRKHRRTVDTLQWYFSSYKRFILRFFSSCCAAATAYHCHLSEPGGPRGGGSEREIDVAGRVPAATLAALAHPPARDADLGSTEGDARGVGTEAKLIGA